ncbi:PREDICTED: keratin-associated protein 13-1-like [Elephantulus edwardii]|uniref:keratin-associated protein 13-1-like n=1 Tax=Elephantulus edwardii TaxID=28737 RepID=UPI0003F0CC2D|nr:PREDICTED: keratin-associated protein 13-1-like [Elephantulus edwardii]
MSYNCCSGNFSSYSLGSSLRYPVSSCGSSYPSNLVYSTGLCSPSNYQLSSSFYRRGQETCCEPRSCHTSRVVSSPCQTSCYRPSTSTSCSPCQTPYTGSLGFGSSSSCSLGYGSRSCYSDGCGSNSFRPLSYGIRDFSSLGCGSRFSYPNYLPSRTCQSSCYRSACGSGFY